MDVILGTFNYEQPAVSIGASYPDGLYYQAGQMGNGWVANLRSGITASGSTYIVTIDGVSDRFTKSGTTYTSTEGNGATLVENATAGTLTYVARTGTSAVFAPNSGAYRVGFANVSSITYANGVQVSFTYKVTTFCPNKEGAECIGGYKVAIRLQSVNNSNGYQLKLTYGSDTLDSNLDYAAWIRIAKVQAINNAVDYCNPAADACALTGSWPTLNIGANSVTDSLGRTTSYATAYDSGGFLSSFTVTRPGSSSPNVSVGYDTSRRVNAVTIGGVSYTYAYSDITGQRTTTVTDPYGKTKVYIGNTTIGRLMSFTDELGRVTSYAYDAKGRSTLVTLPEGNKVQYDYDNGVNGRGNVVTTTRIPKSGSPLGTIVTSASFAASCTNTKTCNLPLTTTDAMGRITDYSYDGTHGGVLTVTQPAATAGAVRPQRRFGYSSYQGYYKNSGGSIVASGAPTYRLTSTSACTTSATCASAAEEVKAIIGYGPQSAGVANNLLPVSQSAGSGDGSLTATTTTTWDAVGNATYIDGPLAGTADTTRAIYDAARQMVGVIGPDPDGAGALPNRAVRATYRPDGQVSQVAIGTAAGQSDAAWSSFASAEQQTTGYDANSRPTSVAATAGGTIYGMTQMSYDALGRIDCTALRMNGSAWGSLPASACTAQTTGADGPDRINKNAYTFASEVQKMTSAYGTTDAADEATFTYSASGHTATMTDANGNVTSYSYDGHDRPSTTTYVGGSYEQLTYDTNSNVTQRRLRDGILLSYDYDALNRRIVSTVPSNANPDDTTTSYQYDLLGRLTRAAKNPTNQTVLAYDALGRKTNESNYYYGVASQYDNAGRRTRLTWNDGFFVTYDYDAAGAMTTIRENGGFVLATFGYDSLGRLTSLTRGNGAVTNYGYDAVSRLATLGHAMPGTPYWNVGSSFAHNGAGQIASSTRSHDGYAWTGHYNVDRPYVVNGLNQLTSAGATALGYDARGNLTSSGSTSYSYTSTNRLGGVAGVTALFADSLDRLDYVSAEHQLFGYDGAAVVSEVVCCGTTLARRYVYGPGTDEPLVWYEGSGLSDRRWLHADERGSVVAITDGAGAALAINRYDEYGIPQSGNVGRFQYTGQKWLPSVGLYDYKARMYSPTLGRFMQTDPIGYGDGINWYNYVGSDPVNRTDPSGLYQAQITTCVPGTSGWGPDGDLVVSATRCRLETVSISDGGGFGNLAAVGGGRKKSPTPAPQNEKKLSQCMIGFIGSQGYNTKGLGNVTFYNGSLTAQSVYNTMGNPAITIGNSIHVASSAWGRISTPSGGATYFEEIVHTRQYESWGMAGFGAAYGVASVMGKYNTGDAHNNPVENQAIAMANQLSRAYNKLPASKKCSD